MALSCAELLRRLDADEALDDADAREHLAACPACRTALARWRAAAGEIHAWAEEAPPAFLHSRIMASLRDARAGDRPRPVAWPWRRPLWASSALAAVFVVVVAGVALLRAPTSRLLQEETTSTRDRTAPPASVEVVPPASPADGERVAKEKSVPPARAARAVPRAESSHLSAGRVAPSHKDEAERQIELPVEVLQPAPEARSEQLQLAEREARPEVDGLGRRDAEQQRRAQESRSAAISVVQPGAAARPAPVPRGVVCRLVPLTGGTIRLVRLSLAALGDSAAYVSVDASGWARLEVDHSRGAESKAGVAREGRQRGGSGRLDEVALEEGDRSAIEGLGLPPGRYRIERSAE